MLLKLFYSSQDIQPGATIENKATNADVYKRPHQKLCANRMWLVEFSSETAHVLAVFLFLGANRVSVFLQSALLQTVCVQ